MYIDTETLVTTIYFVVDNWYLTEGYKYLTGKAGRKPEFTDSEMITFIILKEFLQFRTQVPGIHAWQPLRYVPRHS